MQLPPELYILTLVILVTMLMWLPYVIARIMTRGLKATLGNPDSSLPADPAWAMRAKMAHANAIENLTVFAPLVIVSEMFGLSTPATILAANVYLVARLVHYFVYTIGIPVLRTVAFFTGFCATVTFAASILLTLTM